MRLFTVSQLFCAHFVSYLSLSFCAFCVVTPRLIVEQRCAEFLLIGKDVEGTGWRQFTVIAGFGNTKDAIGGTDLYREYGGSAGEDVMADTGDGEQGTSESISGESGFSSGSERGKMADRLFSANYDRMARIISVSIVVVLMAVPLLLIMASDAVAAIAALISGAVIVLAYAYSPRGYEVTSEALRVKRLIWDVVFPLASLRYVRDTAPGDFRGCVRLWASGGLFGYFGLFSTKTLGECRWYVTDRSKAVVLADGSQTVLVSPEDRDGFLAAIEHTDTPALPTSEESSRSGRSLQRNIGFIGFAIGAIALVTVACALLYSPGRPPVDLTQHSLVIHSRFYGMTVPASSVDVAHVRVIDLRNEPGWKPVLRTNGFGNPHYQAGNFKTANGRIVRLFTTGSERLVLLPPSSKDEMPVLLDVAEPDRFVARLHQEWAGQ